MEEMLIDTPCFRRFAGIETMEGRIPDETTILEVLAVRSDGVH
jgi:IS5 family transposase